MGWKLGLIGASLVLASMAQAEGDPARGRALLLQRHDTGCILCHAVPGLPLGGAMGPALHGIGSRLTAAELRARIGDARRFNPDTIMPPYLSTTDLQNVGRAYAGKTVLSEQALDDIVAYLSRESDADVPATGRAPAAAASSAPGGAGVGP